MRIVIWGGGAIGGATAAFLTRAGYDVLLVHRGLEHVAAIDRHGLRILEASEEWVQPLCVMTPDKVEGRLDQVLLAVRSQHTEAALEQILPLLAPGGTIVSLQSGLNVYTIAKAVGAENTIGSVVHWSADVIAPGVIRHGSRGSFIMGDFDGCVRERTRHIGQNLQVVVDKVVLTDNIVGYLWAKLVYGCLQNSTALVDETIPNVLRSPTARHVIRAIVAEAVEVAMASGIDLPPYDYFDGRILHGGSPAEVEALFEELASIKSRQVKQKTTLWRDIAVAGRPTEVDHVAGEVVRRGEIVGRPTPLNARLVEMIHEMEVGRRAMAWDNFAELERMMSR